VSPDQQYLIQQLEFALTWALVGQYELVADCLGRAEDAVERLFDEELFDNSTDTPVIIRP